MRPLAIGAFAFAVASAAPPTQILAPPAADRIRRVYLTFRNTHASLNMSVTAADSLGLVFAGQAAAGAHVATSNFTLIPLTIETGPLAVSVVGGPTAQVHGTYVDYPKPFGFAAETTIITSSFQPVSICSPAAWQAVAFLDMVSNILTGLNQSSIVVVNNDQPGSAPLTQVRLTRGGAQYIHTTTQAASPSRLQMGGSYNMIFLPGDLFEVRCTTAPQFVGTIVTRWYVQRLQL